MTTCPTSDHYAVLGLEKNATLTEIKAQYRHLSLRLHPDRTAGDLYKLAKFKAVTEAYSILSDITSRGIYDAELEEASRKELSVQHLDLDDTDYHSDTDDYNWACRCGSACSITSSDLAEGYNVVECIGCSLQTEVHYEEA